MNLQDKNKSTQLELNPKQLKLKNSFTKVKHQNKKFYLTYYSFWGDLTLIGSS